MKKIILVCVVMMMFSCSSKDVSGGKVSVDESGAVSVEIQMKDIDKTE